ncbi:response regulator [Hymenobacter convexus]|uniref:response regulator n=1 Tax=Hymenobacter sp. CA1UV-4 TaxID=3063782 RepID=UPI002712C6DE|nr:response regulator [Hymenobacter sp. CA1UV-4]MDO7850265.1 response regulator [Hymenobacter sp. CA1UV-4]
MHTLLIDDDEIAVFLTERLLRRENFSDDIAAIGSGAEALAFLQKASVEELPRVIFLDLNMPEMDGWELLDALQPLQARLRGRCHIYILTSSLAHADAARGQASGLVAGLIRKPIDRDQILAVRAQLTPRPGPE